MRLLVRVVCGFAVWSIAAAAQAAPRNGMATIPDFPQQPRQPTQPAFPDARPFKPYKPYSAYGEGSKSLTPRTGPQYAPGYKPYTPPFREKGTFGGSQGTFGRDRGTF